MGDLLADKNIIRLSGWLEPSGPSGDEWGMHCPLHNDRRRSASLNVTNWKWWCNVCEIRGMDVEDLIDEMDRQGVKGRSKELDSSKFKAKKVVDVDPLDSGLADAFHKALMSEKGALNELMHRRGLDAKTLRTYQIGWDSVQNAYTIPVFDKDGELVNIRFYDPDPKDERRKIWSVPGHGSPVLYPIDMLEEGVIFICEGEWDSLLTIQNGFAAITRTSSAKTWRVEWNDLFRDKQVYIVHDMDHAGQEANSIVANNLRNIAKSISIVRLPYEVTAKHGKDLSDYWQSGVTPGDFVRLCSEGEEITLLHEQVYKQEPPVELSVIDTFDGDNFAKKLTMRVTVTGRNQSPYMVAKRSMLTCDMQAGPKCEICPMKVVHQGETVVVIKPYDPIILNMVGSNEKFRDELIKEFVKPQKCTRLVIESQEQYTVEELFVRPAIDHTDEDRVADYANRKVFVVDSHDDLPNSTVRVVGAIYSNPRTAHNEFLAWEVARTETDIDNFQPTAKFVSAMRIFKPAARQTPLNKILEITKELATGVTGIIGRPEMHMMIDLTIHSVLEFDFLGAPIHRGWLESLIIGDTRTGKSEAAQKILQHYQMGEVVSCEGASFAGVVGGLEQVGGKDWVVKWGAIPLNDRRVVVLDEVAGLSTDQISQMSSIRSSGEAQLTKIQSERTLARTRLIWLSNPRGGGKIGDYTYGAGSLMDLIGTNEDVARFDLAMSVSRDEVDAKDINQMRTQAPPIKYTPDLCHELVRWCWTRKKEHIKWEPGAEKQVLTVSLRLARRYCEDPPLVQGANVRIKIARLAAAIAARTFSTDATGQDVIINLDHVNAAYEFMDRVYSMPGFGYQEVSNNQFEDEVIASNSHGEAYNLFHTNIGLATFLSRVQTFKRSDVESVLGCGPEFANALIRDLHKWRMVNSVNGVFKVEQTLNRILRSLVQRDRERMASEHD